MKTWKTFGDDCPRCGDTSEAYTHASDDGFAFDGDDIRCAGCGLQGSVCVDDEEIGTAHVEWNDYDD